MTPTSSFVSESLHVHESILQTIGKTPLVRLNRVASHVQCHLYAKVEFFNPGGSIKDRIGLNIIAEAEQSGRLKPGGTIVESTSGNTGHLAIVAAIKGYKTVFVLPDKMSQGENSKACEHSARGLLLHRQLWSLMIRVSYYSVAKQIVAETPHDPCQPVP
jgi:cystathionine beta-synthase